MWTYITKKLLGLGLWLLSLAVEYLLETTPLNRFLFLYCILHYFCMSIHLQNNRWKRYILERNFIRPIGNNCFHPYSCLRDRQVCLNILLLRMKLQCVSASIHYFSGKYWNEIIGKLESVWVLWKIGYSISLTE